MGPESFLPDSPVPVPEPLGSAAANPPEGRTHLVVVRTRPATEPARAAAGEIVATYWHPRQRAWQKQTFESLEHALHLYLEENGWELRQQQPLDRAGAEELIFAGRVEELDQPSARELLLEEVGLSPEDTEALLDRVDEQTDPPTR